MQLVPTTFQFRVPFAWNGPSGTNCKVGNPVCVPIGIYNKQFSDREGLNGLPFTSNGDPRSQMVTVAGSADGDGNYRSILEPPAYLSSVLRAGYYPFRLAGGVEAQLITAEAALQAGNANWLTILNTLRQSVGLPSSSDPGTAKGRDSLLFAERAEWLYLTGERQGDLRRLLRLHT